MESRGYKLALEFLIRAFYPHMSGSDVISLEQVIIEAEKSTSPGYPHNLMFRVKGEYFCTDEFFTAQRIYWSLLAYQQVPIFWNSSDKVEMRDIDKIHENKIRAFTASSAQHSIALSRVCFDMNERFYKSAHDTPSFVGTTKYYGEWDRRVRKLAKHPNCYALDCSSYDASLLAFILWTLCAFRILCLKASIRENYKWRLYHLYDCIINSILVLPTGEIVIKETGNTSGNGNTIGDNTLGLALIVYYCFVLLWFIQFPDDCDRETYLEQQTELDQSEGEELAEIKSRKLSYELFLDHVELDLNGDDNTFSVSDEVNVWFNGRALAGQMEILGFKVTSECWDPRPAWACDFLSHDTVWNTDLLLYLPSPRRDRILDSLLYGSNNIDPRWSLLRACALRMESWANLDLRSEIQDFIEFLYTNYSVQLRGFVVVQKSGEKIYMEQINALYFTDAELASLYSGFEAMAYKSRIKVQVLECALQDDTSSIQFVL